MHDFLESQLSKLFDLEYFHGGIPELLLVLLAACHVVAGLLLVVPHVGAALALQVGGAEGVDDGVAALAGALHQHAVHFLRGVD